MGGYRHAPRPLVDAHEARAHLLRLAEQGVGARQVSRLTGVSCSAVREVRAGLRPRIRQATADRLLRCPAQRSRYALVTAWWPRRHVSALLSEGFTVRQVSRALRVHLPTLEQAQRVRVQTAVRINQWYRAVIDDADFGRRADWLRTLEA